jgi:threonine dehydrogenase-like Zn-dependent dehydrogenase
MEARRKIMAKFGADIVLYKTTAGFFVPAAVSRYVDEDGADANVAAASATHADIVLLNAAATKLTTVAVATSATFANKDDDEQWEPETWGVPA